MTTRAGRSRAEAADELLTGPISGDLLGAEHLAARARDVARNQRLVTTRIPLRPARLLARLAETRRILTEAQERLLDAAAVGVDAGPAAEWLLDNYHVVQEHLQEVRASLPGGYYRELPELANGPLTGYPRVYEMAISLISHTEARVDPENVDLYVESFQSVAPLSLGELWAMPAMLRLGLIESVRRMTLRTMQRLDEIDLATYWSTRIMEASARGGASLRDALREFADAEHALTPHFVSRFLQLLRVSEGASPPLAWLEHWMRDAGVSPETAIAQSTHRLTLTQLMMANSITSLRDIGRRDWREFVESQSAMEAILRTDPSGDYPMMTFATRDQYRHVVERIAKQTLHREASVAQWAIDLALLDSPAAPITARRHVGYYLVDDGVLALERMAGYAPTLAERLERMIHRHPDSVFVGGIALLVLAAIGGVLLIAEFDGGVSLGVLLLLAFLPALDIAVTVMNQLVTALLPPAILPRLDLNRHGVPAAYRTAVVIPTLFGCVDDVRDALETLEVQFLANRETHLHFAILSDFTDAASETTAGDAAIVAAAIAGIRALNARHDEAGVGPFHLLHRPRRWNAAEGVWMGWERKRGKLAEFNRLIRGGADGAFSVQEGATASLTELRYVITLDADTVLPPDAAPSLIGAMAHPLNRAVIDGHQAIIRGFGILQPRVGVSLPSAHRSRFATIASGHPGVDPYSTAVSDVYQDLFGEGTFTGKGIYDIDAFQAATHGRFPENTLLSHDLIEGNYARAGLSTDVIVYDDYPATYIAWTRRKHRWIRGDWQLLPWLHRRVPGPDGPESNRLSLVSQWKIIDNLRRSTVELAQLLFLIGGWALLPEGLVRWTVLGLGAVVAPWVTALVLAVLRPPLDKSWRAYYDAVGQDALVSLEQAVVAVITLPHQAYVSADAIVRTLYRLWRSHRHMLEWQSASLVERSIADIGATTRRAMRRSTLLVALVMTAVVSIIAIRERAPGAALTDLQIPALLLAILTGCWLAAPRIMAALSQPAVAQRRHLAPAGRETALRYAAAHWRYFSTFVTEATHWLAPDNFQADPEPVVAMRTSPTNIGLQLLATVSAADLGLLSVPEMTGRLEQTMATLATLPRYRGHFYNWYDLTDLRVLDPPYISTVDSGNFAGHMIALRQACLGLAGTHPELRERLLDLAAQAYGFLSEMEFAFLYDESRKLFTIGYHPESYTPDDSYYDLLASEARLASFVAIARNDVPVEHWFRLSRSLSRTAGSTALVSWSGSMFEYLMPVLVMRSLPFTLLAQTYEGVVDRHRAYARSRSVPWGISESAWNVRDRHQTYQYRAFGIPDLALKRGLGRDLVVAPYATALAAQIDPTRALQNLGAMEAMGALGPYGFCDALDYTRPAAGASVALVRSYFAHHVGMTLVALTNVLLADRWQDRFHADTLVKSVELLLHERIPRRLVLQEAQVAPPDEARPSAAAIRPVVREIDTQQSAAPRVSVLGALPYTVMLNHSGSGYSRYDDIAVTRWRADGTTDDTGQYCYIADLTTERTWSSGRQPLGGEADASHASMALDRVTLHRCDGEIETRTEITVVPSDGAEVRRITLTNNGDVAHTLELTSYAEVVMTAHAADVAHPAFSNLFVETEWHAWCTAITATRRPRSPADPHLWCVHVVDTGRDRVDPVSCETDRARFIGRGRTVRNPAALLEAGPLSGTTGSVLDPIVSLRTRVVVAPGQSVSVAFTTLVATTRESAFELAGRYHDSHAAQRALDFAWTSTQIELRELGISPADATTFQEIATQLLFGGGTLAPPPDELRRARGAQPQLWAHGISGDLPIVLATITSADGLPTLRELFLAHRYWRRRGLAVDLVVLNAHPYDYLQELRDSITEAMITTDDASVLDRAGGVFVRRRELFAADELLTLAATARVQITCDGRSLNRVLRAASVRVAAIATESSSMPALRSSGTLTPPSTPVSEKPGPLATIVSALLPLVAPLLTRAAGPVETSALPLPVVSPLDFANGIGGLAADDSYQIRVDGDVLPPAPWANVIANAHGGFLVTERGAGCTWAENAYFYRITPWFNDPVSDPAGDALYLQDEESGALWSPTPGPVDGGGAYQVAHGAGWSTFEHQRDGIQTELRLGVPTDAAVKVATLRLTNRSGRPRHLVLTAYAEWALGARRDDSQQHLRTRYAPEHQAMLAQNRFDPQFAGWTAFLATSEAVVSHTADRQSFLGRLGHASAPEALRRRDPLDGVTGVGLDQCGALQSRLTLGAGETRDVTVLLGAAPTERDARTLLQRLLPPSAAAMALSEMTEGWRARLTTITVQTPDRAFDAMLNTWSLYQALGCRMWARMGLYQSSGAYGFRDQLQDSMALLYAEPALAREHILRAAARQFVEGDVQHWWHAHTGRGVRTRFSDDLVWLPYVVNQYIRITGDAAILDAYVPFLTMRSLEPHEHEVYDLPMVTEEHGSLYEHCRRALRRACTEGAHGLPLIGSGDWNDGMSRVGADGRGESVWLAWFLLTTLRQFAHHADARWDTPEAAHMRFWSDRYAAACEQHGWDGAWYRRAFYDDGTPIGSAASAECRIDSIAQSWSVIAGVAPAARQAAAMQALDAQLVWESERLIVLLTPPFDGHDSDPGYIRGYLPGVRENGGQYTHAALWAVLATAMQGDGDRAFTLFQMLNPLTHAATADDVTRYKVEPYVVAADVYTAPSHIGRGGWTWYTGSASWMYRVALEEILGFRKTGNTIRIAPCVPADWPAFTIGYRHGRSTYHIVVESPAAVAQHGALIAVDGVAHEAETFDLLDDGLDHTVHVAPRSVRRPEATPE